MPGLTQLTRICLGASSSAVHLKSRGKHPVGSGSGRIWIRLDQDPAGSGSGWIRSNQDPVEKGFGLNIKIQNFTQTFLSILIAQSFKCDQKRIILMGSGSSFSLQGRIRTIQDQIRNSPSK